MIKKAFFAKWSSFLGYRVGVTLALGVLTGLLLFCVELAFAYGLQAFLLVLGVAVESSVYLPSWIPYQRFEAVLAFICTAAFLRGALQWAQLHLQKASGEYFRSLQRSRILAWALGSESASTSYVTVLLGETANVSSNAVAYLQTGVLQVSCAIAVGISLLVLSPRVTLVAGLSLVVVVWPMRRLSRVIKVSGEGIAREWDQISTRLVMSIKNLLLLRIYGMEAREEERLQRGLENYQGHLLRYSKMSALMLVVPQTIGVIVVVLLTYAASSYGELAAGALLSYFYLFVRFLQNVSSSTYTVSSFIFCVPQLRTMEKWWERHCVDHAPAKSLLAALREKHVRLPAIAGPIGWRISDVDFKYPETSSLVLSGLHLDITPGSVAVIVGPSGVGKSTLLGLLLGELLPTRGSVDALIDGRVLPVSKNESRILRNIGYVGPESFLLEGTVLSNIIYGLETPPGPEELREAIQKAECQFIHDLPRGLDHVLTEQGQGLSAGQKQRLSLARALLRKPKALILDEATSNLDSETEERLIETLLHFKGQMTVVAVTHRTALLKIADQQLRLASPCPTT